MKQTAHQRQAYSNSVFSDTVKAGLCTLAAWCHLQAATGSVNKKSSALLSVIFVCVQLGQKKHSAMSGSHSKRQPGECPGSLETGTWSLGTSTGPTASRHKDVNTYLR